jgi:hypothetical protein
MVAIIILATGHNNVSNWEADLSHNPGINVQSLPNGNAILCVKPLFFHSLLTSKNNKWK